MSASETTPPTRRARGPLAWMAGHSVAANLLMLVFIVGGLLFALRIKQEVFPDFALDMVTVSVSYPGASPAEVERSIVQVIEERVQGLEDVSEVTATAREGGGTVTIEMLEGGDIQKLANEVENEVNRITTFPEEAEEARVAIAARDRQVLSLLIHGNVSLHTLKSIAESMRDNLLNSPDITRVEIGAIPPPEISIEIARDTLRQYGLTLSDVASAVRQAAVEVPGGGIKTRGGEILLRVTERRDYADEFATIPIIARADGTQVLLGDIATIKDTFEDVDRFAVLNGEPSVVLDVYRVGDQTPIQVSRAVHAYLDEHAGELPPGVGAMVWHDRSDIFEQRLDLLLTNGYIGLALVFILLALFLEARLAFWVTLGIPISFLGAFLFLPLMGVSINMVSMFAFIVALGIVVDDAIVVGESIYGYHQEGMPFAQAAVQGARDVAMPVVFSILTNIAAFMPLLFMPGFMGKIFKQIPMVVCTVFTISLIESLFILPSHVGHQHEFSAGGVRGFLHGLQQRFSHGYSRLIETVYGPLVRRAVRIRYITVAIGVGLLLVTLAYVRSGRMGMTLFPRIESDEAAVTAVLPYGAATERTVAVRDRLLKSARQVVAANGGTNLAEGILADVDGNRTEVRVMLTEPKRRPISTAEFARQWREDTGPIPGLESISFASDRGGPGRGAALTIELSHRDVTVLEQACTDLAAALAEFPKCSDIDDGFSPGKKQFDFTILPTGQSLGLTAMGVARQVRNSFYGAEAIRQQRGRDELKIMVRLPESERVSAYDLEELIIRTPAGKEVPLRSVVKIEKGRAYTTLNRRNGRRVMTVTADVNPPQEAGRIQAAIEADTLPTLLRKYPGLSYGYEGRQADMRESLQSLFMGFGLAMFVVYALLAVPLNSYTLPLIIMVSIPFGIVGAVIGHIIMGYSLSVMSMMGIVALSGVVVNDSLVLIDLTSRHVRRGLRPFEAVTSAAVRRFRPIMLTTLTTFGGLAPIIMESSRQARFLIPMAISLGFGVLFATLITLVLVPCLYMAVQDVHGVVGARAAGARGVPGAVPAPAGGD